MRIDLSKIDQEQFFITEGIIAGEKCFLVQPKHVAIRWTQENSIFRSSIWNENGEPVSLSFKKFTNWGENPSVFPVPKTLEGCTAVEKIDGSALIVSKYKGQLILRTRGTFDATIHDNGAELWEFKLRIADEIEILLTNMDTWPASYIFEWTSPANRIILSYGDKPGWRLIGRIMHSDYNLATQNTLDLIAKFRKWGRPKTYEFRTIEGLIENVELWKGFEGVCLYSNNDQTIHKIKSLDYLRLHRLKSELSSLDKLIDQWLSNGRVNKESFKKKLAEIFDYELIQQLEVNLDKLEYARNQAEEAMCFVHLFVRGLNNLPRKDAALKIIEFYGNRVEKGIAFSLLNGKEINDRTWKSLLLQCMK